MFILFNNTIIVKAKVITSIDKYSTDTIMVHCVDGVHDKTVKYTSEAARNADFVDVMNQITAPT